MVEWPNLAILHPGSQIATKAGVGFLPTTPHSSHRTVFPSQWYLPELLQKSEDCWACGYIWLACLIAHIWSHKWTWSQQEGHKSLQMPRRMASVFRSGVPDLTEDWQGTGGLLYRCKIFYGLWFCRLWLSVDFGFFSGRTRKYVGRGHTGSWLASLSTVRISSSPTDSAHIAHHLAIRSQSTVWGPSEAMVFHY